MAFIANDWSPVGANARRGVVPQQFAYTSEDSLATVKASGYFDDLFATLVANDWISVTTSTGTTPVFTIIFVAAVTAGVVTIVTVDISAA